MYTLSKPRPIYEVTVIEKIARAPSTLPPDPGLPTRGTSAESRWSLEAYLVGKGF